MHGVSRIFSKFIQVKLWELFSDNFIIDKKGVKTYNIFRTYVQ